MVEIRIASPLERPWVVRIDAPRPDPVPELDLPLRSGAPLPGADALPPTVFDVLGVRRYLYDTSEDAPETLGNSLLGLRIGPRAGAYLRRAQRAVLAAGGEGSPPEPVRQEVGWLRQGAAVFMIVRHAHPRGLRQEFALRFAVPAHLATLRTINNFCLAFIAAREGAPRFQGSAVLPLFAGGDNPALSAVLVSLKEVPTPSSYPRLAAWLAEHALTVVSETVAWEDVHEAQRVGTAERHASQYRATLHDLGRTRDLPQPWYYVRDLDHPHDPAWALHCLLQQFCEVQDHLLLAAEGEGSDASPGAGAAEARLQQQLVEAVGVRAVLALYLAHNRDDDELGGLSGTMPATLIDFGLIG
jgi:hypothetical protein